MRGSQKKKCSRSQAMRLKKKQQNRFLSKSSILIIIALFVCCLGILGERLVISKLDQEVQELEKTMEELRSENDAKQGKLTASQSDTEIKATAKSYGMVEVTAEQKIVETITEQSINDVSIEENSWVHRFWE